MKCYLQNTLMKCLTINVKNIELISKYNYHTKQVTKYLNIESAFDIETSSTYVNNEKFAFMYEWTFGIGNKDNIFFGRNWEDFKNFLSELKEILNLSKNKLLVVYVHNLSYEFQFMRKYFNWDIVFAISDRKPIKATCFEYGIEFRDSYILSGYSLAKLAENLTSHKIKKLVGDLDYFLIRHEKTYLSDSELEYCNNDVEILLYYINEQIELYNDITKIPMTNTGRVRQFVKNRTLYNGASHRKNTGSNRRYKELIDSCTLTLNDYYNCKKCFMGGFTHASLFHVSETLENVHSIDFTSSYPYVMVSELFPMSPPRKIKKDNYKKTLEKNPNGCILEVTFINLLCTIGYESYLSESKCYNIKGSTIVNGRIFEANQLTTYITSIDLQIIEKCYSYDSVIINEMYDFYMQYLPTKLINAILDLYESKTTLKGVEGKEIEYLLKKGMLNSVYGMCVTDIVREETIYNSNNDKWEIGNNDANEQIEKYNKKRDRFLYYPWGIWVTAYARFNLWQGIFEIGNDYVYSDTDSIKFLNYEKHKKFIDTYNKKCEQKLKNMCDYMGVNFKKCKPKTIKGKEKLLGIYDYEGCYKLFKTLGAKRYIYVDENNKLHITIAGLSKENGCKYLLEKYKNFENIFKNFNDDLYVPTNKTGKNTHTYIDSEKEYKITDYTGNTMTINAKSSVHLSECDFTLNIAKQYAKIIDNFRHGYLTMKDWEI